MGKGRKTNRWCEFYTKGAFGYSSLINFLPTIGVLGSTKLQNLYGVPITDVNHLLMMRHRAVLFGVVGGVLGGAVVSKRWRPLSYVIGIASMASYVVLAISQSWDTPSALSLFNDKIQRVFWIDLVGVLWLGSAGIISWWNNNFEDDVIEELKSR